ncbi:MAG: hypothetical protein QOI45_1511 [Thermoleophilaceae bacterium]|jgi:hypothetical protein|nr:hypothetical protein [Thermoleophilaceae bacterium]
MASAPVKPGNARLDGMRPAYTKPIRSAVFWAIAPEIRERRGPVYIGIGTLILILILLVVLL